MFPLSFESIAVQVGSTLPLAKSSDSSDHGTPQSSYFICPPANCIMLGLFPFLFNNANYFKSKTSKSFIAWHIPIPTL